MNSPLMIGCDIRNMSEATHKILTNKEVIALNQDPEGRQAYSMEQWNNSDVKIYVKPMSDGSLGIGFFNMGDADGEDPCSSMTSGFRHCRDTGFISATCGSMRMSGYLPRITRAGLNLIIARYSGQDW